MKKIGLFLLALMVAVQSYASTNVVEEISDAITGQVDSAMPLIKGLLILAGTLIAIFVGFKLLKRGAAKI